MAQILSLWSLPLSSKVFLAKTIGLLGLIRLGLWILPFQTLRQLLDNLSRTSSLRTPNPTVTKRIVEAVQVGSRYVPKATCLTQALAVQVMLWRRGYPATLNLGVTKDEQGGLEAHAWVESEGQIVIGGADSPANFVPLPPLEGKF